MGHPHKLVMQVTVDAQDCPGLFGDLSRIGDGKRRASKLLRMAYIGWLLEQGRVGVTTIAAPGTPAQDSPVPRSKIDCTITEYVEHWASDG